MAASDDFKAQMKKCLKGQEEFLEFAPMLKTAVIHEIPKLKDRADDADKTLQLIQFEVAKFGETNDLLKQMSKDFRVTDSSVMRMLTNQERDTKDFERLESALNDMGSSIREQVKGVDERVNNIDERARMETIKVNDRLVTLETRQGGILAFLAKAFPWAVSFASLALVFYKTFK